MGTRAARLTTAVALAASLLLQATPAAAPASAGSEAIPDLAVAPLTDFSIQSVGGQRLLRFSAMMVNPGAGHFELRGSRASTSEPMSMTQVIYHTTARDTISREIATPAVAQYSGDGHDHWHIQEMMLYDLSGQSGAIRAAKVGFCFLDSDPYDLSLPGASPGPFYHASSCGHDPNALSNLMGVSIGWGDLYGWNLAFQWVDITGLPAGTYTVRARVDPHGFFLESNEVDQCAFATLSISDSDDVSVIQTGTACVNDWSDTEFAGDIAWAFSSGITAGCAHDLFCPRIGVSREQMASFLARARSLPPSGTDFFADDEASIHEDDINRIAAAGITVGCDVGLFCPQAGLNREQMASFLVRAFSLSPTASDFFADDEESMHEDDINSLAASGITFGCGGPSFCPTGTVTRGQMAAFLHRAMTD